MAQFFLTDRLNVTEELLCEEGEKHILFETSNLRMDAKEALVASSGAVSDTTTLATQVSSLSVAEESSNAPVPQGPSSLYQVFILAGFGHGYVHQNVFRYANNLCSLYPLTEEDNLPKALLPVANTPLIYFPIQWCTKAGFSGIFLL